MQKYLAGIGLLFLVITISSCTEGENEAHTEKAKAENKPLKELEWMLGAWEMKGEGMAFFEEWKNPTDTMYQGRGYLVKHAGDTIVTELLRLVHAKGDIYYEALPMSSKTAEWVPFLYTGKDSGRYAFRNPEHDFPQLIIYEPQGVDSIHATIVGMEDGKPAQETFKMGKKK